MAFVTTLHLLGTLRLPFPDCLNLARSVSVCVCVCVCVCVGKAGEKQEKIK